jgi:hypothetical protein
MRTLIEGYRWFSHKNVGGLIKEQVKRNATRINEVWAPDCYGAPIESYENYFRSILEGKSIVDLVRQKPSPVVIDLMGPSDTLVSLFEKIPDKLKFGLALSFLDMRDGNKKERDKKIGIEQLKGDILKKSTWKEIEKILDGKKADLIMQRALAGLLHIPLNGKLYALLLRRAWNLLSDNQGVFLIQFPFGSKSVLEDKGVEVFDWITLIRENGIDVVYSSNALKLTKSPNSPKKLPFLK